MRHTVLKFYLDYACFQKGEASANGVITMYKSYRGVVSESPTQRQLPRV